MESNHSCRSFRYSRERNGEEKKERKHATSTSFPPSPFSTREKDAVIKRLWSFPQAQTGYTPVTFIILRDISSFDGVLEMEVPQEVNLVTVILYM